MCGRFGFYNYPNFYNYPGNMWFIGGMFILRVAFGIALLVLGYKLIKSFLDKRTPTN